MEVNLSSVLISFVSVFFLSLAWRVFNWAWLKPKQLEKCLRNQGFKGNSYKLLLGDFKQIMSVLKEAKSKSMDASDNDIMPLIMPLHRPFVKLHGKNYFQWLGPTPQVALTDPKLIKEILLNHEDFRKGIIIPLGKLLITGLVTLEGEEWVKHRNLISPAFHLEMLKQMVPAMYTSCIEMIGKLEVLAPRKGSTCEVDVSPYIANLTGDVISRTAFGSNYEEGKGIFELQKTQSEITFAGFPTVYVPGSRFLPTQANKKIKAIYHEVRALLTNIINKRKQITDGENWGCDLLGIMLRTNTAEKELLQHGNKKTIELTTEELIDECKLFYIAGQETTSALLAWTMVLLSRHQKWQHLAREEVLAAFGDKEPEYNELNQLKTVSMILNEVLRLYPPVSYIYRRVHKTTSLGELHLPQGVNVFVPTIAIHQDPELWGKDAKEFKPERFSEGIAKATKGRTIFLPFGGGPRICIGQNFAMLEAKIALAVILRNFEFKLSPSYIHAPSLVINVQPKHGVQLILRKI